MTLRLRRVHAPADFMAPQSWINIQKTQSPGVPRSLSHPLAHVLSIQLERVARMHLFALLCICHSAHTEYECGKQE